MIYVDASRYNNTDKRTGVENYSFFLINELIKQVPGGITLIAPKKVPLDAPQITIPFPRLWTQIRLSWKLLANKKIDNLFVPSHLMPIIHPKNTTITIHDVAFKRFPESYGHLSRWYLNWGAKFAVKHAKNIIVPSETTKKDLIKFYKAKPKKIHVIPLGIEKAKQKEEKPAQSPELKAQSYFLYIGRLETKKNTGLLVKSFKTFAEKNPGIKLVLAGKPGRGYELFGKELNHPNILQLGYVSDTEKWWLLKNCLAFVFPSIYEGFGIPLLEAMQAKAPIIASKIPTSYSIAKGNALFFKPTDSKALAEHMETLTKNKSARTKLVQNHERVLKEYSWGKCGRETLKILEQKK